MMGFYRWKTLGDDAGHKLELEDKSDTEDG